MTSDRLRLPPALRANGDDKIIVVNDLAERCGAGYGDSGLGCLLLWAVYRCVFQREFVHRPMRCMPVVTTGRPMRGRLSERLR